MRCFSPVRVTLWPLRTGRPAFSGEGDLQGADQEEALPPEIHRPGDRDNEEVVAQEHRQAGTGARHARLHPDCARVLRPGQLADLPGAASGQDLPAGACPEGDGGGAEGAAMHPREEFYPPRHQVGKHPAQERRRRRGRLQDCGLRVRAVDWRRGGQDALRDREVHGAGDHQQLLLRHLRGYLGARSAVLLHAVRRVPL